MIVKIAYPGRLRNSCSIHVSVYGLNWMRFSILCRLRNDSSVILAYIMKLMDTCLEIQIRTLHCEPSKRHLILLCDPGSVYFIALARSLDQVSIPKPIVSKLNT
jgi:hypothetical protein